MRGTEILRLGPATNSKPSATEAGSIRQQPEPHGSPAVPLFTRRLRWPTEREVGGDLESSTNSAWSPHQRGVLVENPRDAPNKFCGHDAVRRVAGPRRRLGGEQGGGSRDRYWNAAEAFLVRVAGCGGEGWRMCQVGA